jgi:translation initiation factor 1A
MGGSKHRKRPKFARTRKTRDFNEILKTVDQEYAMIKSKLGNYKVELDCEDGKSRIGRIRGSMRNRIPCRVNDFVLISLRPELDRLSVITRNKMEECDIILKYFDQEVNMLKQNNHIKLLNNIVPEDDEFDFSSEEENDETSTNEKKELEINLDEVASLLDDIEI